MSNYDASIRVNTKVDNADLRNLEKEINSTAKNITDSMNGAGASADNATKRIKQQEGTWDSLSAKAEDYKTRLRALEDKGFGFGDQKYDDLYIAWQNAEYAVKKYRDALNNRTNQEIDRQAMAIRKVQNGFATAEKSGKKCFKVIQNGAKKSNGLLATMGTRLKGIALSLLVFNWITKGFNAMVQAMKEGFQNLAHYSDEYNESMSALKSESAQLKNGLAAAFEPLVNTIVPYLTQFVAWLNTATDAVGQFFTAMQGKSTYSRAKKQVVDYAKSLDSAADSAKGALAAFDNLNVLNKDSGSSGTVSAGGEVGGKDAFEDAQVNEDILNMAQKCKEVFELLAPYAKGFADGFFEFFRELGEVVTPTVAEVLKDIVATLSSGDPENAKSWGEAFAKVFTAFLILKGIGAGISFINGVGKVVSWIGKLGPIIKGVKDFGLALAGVFSANPDILAMSLYQLGELLKGTCLDPDTWDGWLRDAYKSITNGWNDFWDNVFTDIEEGFARTFNWSSANEAFNIAGEWFAKMSEDFKEQDWLGIGADLVNGIGSGVKGVTMTVLEPITDNINAIIEDLIKDIDGLVNYFNNKVKEIQTAKSGLTLGAGVGTTAIGQSAAADGVKLPGLANGMVIQGGKPFAAILGDQPAGQTNIETPLSTMVDAFKQAMSENGGAGGNYTFVAQLDGRTIFKETVRQEQMQYNATGKGAFQH